MSAISVYLSRSDAMYESQAVPADVPWEVKLGPFDDFVQLTYETLRVGPDGDFIGHYHDGYWWINPGERDQKSTGVEPDEYPFSDVTVHFGNPEVDLVSIIDRHFPRGTP